MKFYTFNLQLFAVNATVASGSTGAIVTDGSKTVPYSDHAYANPNNSLAPEMKVFYEKQLLEEAKPNLVHDQFGQKRPIPQGSGKTIEFRKFSSLPKALTPITEGVKPDGQALSVSTVVATVEQYGDYIAQSDILEMTAIDNIVAEANKMLGDQAGRTIDTIVRNVLQANANYMYCPKVSGGSTTPVSTVNAMDKTCALSVRMVKKAETYLKNQNAPKINGSYVAIIHPTAALDIKYDDDFIDVMKYATPENMLNGEIGRIDGVRFVESTEAKVYRPTINLGAGGTPATLTIKSNTGSSTTHDIVVKETPATASSLSTKVKIGSAEFTVTAVTYGASGSTLTVTEDAKDLTANTVIYPKSDWESSDASPVFSTLFLAANAFGTSEISGGGLESIVKQRGSAGTADPLNQVSSEGWKATKTAVVLNPAYMVNVLSASTEFDLDEN